MALSEDPKDQYDEIDKALDFQLEHVRPALRQIKQYAGQDYREDWKPELNVYQPHEAEFVFNTVPNLVYNNPKVEVTGWLPGVDDHTADAVEQGLNQWIEAVGFANKVQQVAYDAMFAWGVTVSTVEVLPGFEDAPEPLPLMPQFHRIGFTRFFQDPQGGRDNWRYRGHLWIADKEDLLKAVDPYTGAPVFIHEAVVDLPEDSSDKDKHLHWGQDRRLLMERKQVIGVELFVRENQTIYTLTTDINGGAWLRQPRPWKGHSDGPYTLYGLYMVPDQPYPLAPLSVTAAMVRELQCHRRQMSEDAASAKRLIAVDSGNPHLRRKIEMAANGTVVGIEGLLKDSIVPIELGGVQKANAEYTMKLEEDLFRASGLNAQRRGETTGATATEVAEISQSEDVRTDFMRMNFRECVTSQLNKAAWQMIRFEDVQFPIKFTQMDPTTGQKVETAQWYVGGIQPGEDPGMAGRLRVNVEPYSMERVDSATKQRRALQVFELVTTTAPLILQMPHVRWEELYNDAGESINVRNMGERYIDFGMVNQMRMAQQMMAMQGQAGGMPLAEGDTQSGMDGGGASGEVDPQLAAMAGAAA